MTELEAINAILSVIQSGGLVAALIIAIRLGLTGEVVPKSVVTAIVRETVVSTVEEFIERGLLTPSSRDS